MSKQDRQGVRTAADLERKYLASLVNAKKAAENNAEKINKTNKSLEEFMISTLGTLDNMQSQIDGNITTWFSGGVPTLSTYPASDWESEEIKANHIGDLYYDQDTGYAYRFAFSDGKYQWMKIVDNDVVEALALANAASDTADSKRRVFTEQPAPPYDSGDLWFKDGDIYICQISKDEGETYAEKDFIIATKYTDDTYAKQVGDELTVVKGTVTTIQEGMDSYKVEISTKVSTLGTELEVAKTSIEANTEAIDLRVKKDSVIAAINVSPEGVKISGSKIDIEGAVTFSSLSSDVSDALKSASSNATTALNNANSAYSQANAAISTANTAKTTADNASKTATNANTTANAASANASTALSTANTANSTANSALSTANNALSTANNVTPFITGTQTTATGAWTGVAPFSSLKDGQQITYWLPYNGSGNATLNLTLSGGTTTGAINCYYGGTTRLTTHYPAGSAIRLTYRVNANVGGTTLTGWWADANYDSGNTYDRIRYSGYVKAASAITANNIIVGDATGYHNLKTGGTFDVSYPILYASQAISAGSTNLYTYTTIPFTVTYTQSMTLTVYKSVYIKGTLKGNTFTPVSTAPLTQTIPTSEDGYSYILLGTAYASTYIFLLSEHPIFKYIEGSFQQVGSGATASAESIKANIYVDGTTKIDGGKIYTNSIKADAIDVTNLFAQDISATGSITLAGESYTDTRFLVSVNGYANKLAPGTLRIGADDIDIINLQIWHNTDGTKFGGITLWDSEEKVQTMIVNNFASFGGGINANNGTITGGSVRTLAGADLDDVNTRMGTAETNLSTINSNLSNKQGAPTWLTSDNVDNVVGNNANFNWGYGLIDNQGYFSITMGWIAIQFRTQGFAIQKRVRYGSTGWSSWSNF